MSKETAKPTRKYIPRDDARRFSDGVRLHPLLDISLTMAGKTFGEIIPIAKRRRPSSQSQQYQYYKD